MTIDRWNLFLGIFNLGEAMWAGFIGHNLFAFLLYLVAGAAAIAFSFDGGKQ